MILARVDGVVVTTVCHPSMVGCRSVVCQPVDNRGEENGELLLAIDPLSAGMHQRVIISTDGANTRNHVGDPKSPLRNMVIAIIDRDDERAAN